MLGTAIMRTRFTVRRGSAADAVISAAMDLATAVNGWFEFRELAAR
jgi:hypothetical protein